MPDAALAQLAELGELAEAWAQASRVVVLTGAGLSTASGIPDFRSPGGRWERYQPTSLQEFLASDEHAAEYWRYKGETWQLMVGATPNPAHEALTALARADRLALLATQNVDGLHERSGFPGERLVNIHGSDARVECVDCGAGAPRGPAQRQWESGTPVPRCEACRGRLKPAVIAFGQRLVTDDLDRAFEAASGCDLFAAVGTSLVVSPINEMFAIARKAGARTAILSAGETPFDAFATWKLRDPVEIALPEVAARVLG